MIVKSLLVGAMGFGLAPKVSAQYQNHHQQYFFLDLQPEVFDTKALCPVDDRRTKKLEWAFVSSFSSSDQGDLKTLLVKLKDNLPPATPFAFEWAKEYSHLGDGASLDVRDVHYWSKGKRSGYILCGKRTRKNRSSYGFLLRTDSFGTLINSKIYPGIDSFESVVPWHNQRGYIAVGQTRPSETGRDAAYVSVRRNLKPICSSRMKGVFPQSNLIESGFRKVIRYKVNKNKAYAMVGSTVNNFNVQCKANSDVLVAMATEKCQVKFVRKYGRDDYEEEQNYSERGLSIAQFSRESGGLVISGNTTRVSQCEERVFDDVLVFKLNNNADVDWMGHYNVDVRAESDVGTAVQMSTGKGETTILVAGETTTDKLGSPADDRTKDAFLLELERDDGEAIQIEVFGLIDGTENGALLPGNLDLHLSRDHHSVIMGNTKVPGDSSSHPYLIERYKNINEFCVDDKFEIRKQDYEFPAGEATSDEIDVKGSRLRLEEADRTLDPVIVCPKDPLFETLKPDIATLKPLPPLDINYLN